MLLFFIHTSEYYMYGSTLTRPNQFRDVLTQSVESAKTERMLRKYECVTDKEARETRHESIPLICLR